MSCCALAAHWLIKEAELPNTKQEVPQAQDRCQHEGAKPEEEKMPVTISCHCGRIRIEVDAELREVVECNCSVCTRSGFLHWYVEPDHVRYLSQGQSVSTYWWRSAAGGQHFCSNCGMAVLRTSTQYPPPLSVNARCIEGIDLAALNIRQFDGKNAYP